MLKNIRFHDVEKVMFKTVGILSWAFLACLTLASVHAQDATSSDLQKRMGGEKVLPLTSGPLVNPLCRFNDQPWFEVSNLRPGSKLQDALEMDFVCTGPLTGTFHVVAMTNGRQHRFPIPATVLRQWRGVITCSYSVLKDKTEFGADVEAYIEFTDAESTFRRSRSAAPVPVNPLYFKVSKSVIRGNVPAVTYARELRPNELRIYEARKKKYGPPPPPPEGFTLAGNAVTLVPGTPILAAFEGDWLKAEILSVSKESMNFQYVVHWPQFGHAQNKRYPVSAIAVANNTVAKLSSGPGSFKPSVQLPEGSLRPPAPGQVLLTDDVQLVPGTPIYVGGNSWEYLVVGSVGDRVTAIRKFHGTRDEVFRRAQLTINKDVFKKLKLANAVDVYAAELAALRKAARKRSFRSYPIRINLPEGFVRVTDATPLKPGMTCKVSWGNQWDDVEVKEAPEEGGVKIYWPKWRSEYVVTLESLIVSEPTGNKAPMEVAANRKAVAGETFRIKIMETKKSRVPVIKLVMDLTDVDLPTAKEVLDFCPIVVKAGLAKSEADKWQEAFEAAGAVVTIEADRKK